MWLVVAILDSTGLASRPWISLCSSTLRSYNAPRALQLPSLRASVPFFLPQPQFPQKVVFLALWEEEPGQSDFTFQEFCSRGRIRKNVPGQSQGPGSQIRKVQSREDSEEEKGWGQKTTRELEPVPPRAETLLITAQTQLHISDFHPTKDTD